MRYADDLITNEVKAAANGERELVTLDKLSAFITNPDNLAELTLDILNGVLPVSEALRQIREATK